MSLLGRCLDRFGAHFGSILEPKGLPKPFKINEKSLKNEGQLSTPKCIRFSSKITKNIKSGTRKNIEFVLVFAVLCSPRPFCFNTLVGLELP